MAVGKSAVGRSLARRLGLRFVDLDREIEKAEGMKVAAIFSRKGEAYFRKAESTALVRTLERDGQVIATGGGVVINEENLKLLQDRTFLLCLTASPEIIRSRAKGGKSRPLLAGGDLQHRIEQILNERQGRYAQAHVSIDTSNLTVAQVVSRIISLLASRETAVTQKVSPSPL